LTGVKAGDGKEKEETPESFYILRKSGRRRKTGGRALPKPGEKYKGLSETSFWDDYPLQKSEATNSEAVYSGRRGRRDTNPGNGEREGYSGNQRKLLASKSESNGSRINCEISLPKNGN